MRSVACEFNDLDVTINIALLSSFTHTHDLWQLLSSKNYSEIRCQMSCMHTNLY